MKIETINSIETSSICDNNCPYCPAPLQHTHRETGFMEWDVFDKAISWVRFFAQQGTQREVNLFGVGEPLLNAYIIDMVEYARKHVPARIPLHLNTNGNNMTERLARALKDAGITSIDITAHNPRPAVRTIRIFQKVGIPFKISLDPVMAPNNWAGQVDWFEPHYQKPYPCPWIGRGQVMVMSNGDVTRCCIDAFGTGVLGTVHNKLDEIEVTPFELCERCHHTLD